MLRHVWCGLRTKLVLAVTSGLQLASADVDSSVSLLQAAVNWDVPPAAEGHYWPHAHGRLGSLSQTSYGLTSAQLKNLDASLAWKWEAPDNLTQFVVGTLIDENKNIIIASSSGLHKLTPSGQKLWSCEHQLTQLPVLMGHALYCMVALKGVVFSVDIETGRLLWKRKVSLTTGVESDMVEGHNGVLIVGVDQATPMSWVGTASLRALAVNATNGAKLWSYVPTCGLWNVMALFPDDFSTIIMDLCGGVYRLNLHTGAELWRRRGDDGSLTDGGSVLGPDGSVYVCSNGPNSYWFMNNKGSRAGRLRKYNVEDGSLLWEAVLDNACMNFPGVSADGETVVLADGANVITPHMLAMHGKPRDEIEKEWAFQQELLRTKQQAQYYGQTNQDASLLGFDGRTGSLKWRHDVEPWYGLSFYRDEERAYLFAKGEHPLGYCGPPHWGPPTIDQFGKVYIARSDGELYIYDPADGTETKFHTGDGTLLGGVSFAPGLMLVPTCSWVYAFRF